ncbi:hypothetical protein TSACC_21670 [Terrimicrobium sacchariphilum]|uniref:Uncharacterized protein n=1 Tax=Terrimicrobium sacchariphilum TaxID=690879 RepID=A0A146G8S4_TERSA|nr:hypothetical protein [Terrimicrobium sacchariphilum]GAT33257.1 hypothetical protein TSACC_21670 [Terrimicrobium sacchariphilum]
MVYYPVPVDTQFGVCYTMRVMPNQRSKGKTHFTASTENELKAAIEKYARDNNLDRNTAIRLLLWQSAEKEGIAVAPEEFHKEVSETKLKNKAKKRK